MDIPHELRPVDTLVRKRQAETPRVASGGTGPAGQTQAPDSSDRVSLSDAATINRYVQVLKTANPTQLHKVEDLRARIADGSYSAEPEELADLILGGGNRAKPGPQG